MSAPEKTVPSNVMLPDDEHNQRLINYVHPPHWVNPTPTGQYNLVVIGGGTAGLVTAAIAAGLGAKVALIERHLMGGDCLNVGCVPSKALIRASRAWADVRRGEEFGLRFSGEAKEDFPAVMTRMRTLRAQLGRTDSAQRFTGLGVDVYLGQAQFTSAQTVQVGSATLDFAKAAICTGARASAPPIPGLQEAGYLTNETIFSLTELPAKLAIIGAGPIGCELAQAFARFGSQLYLIEALHGIMPNEDRDAADIVEKALVRDGVTLFCCGKELTIQKTETGKRLTGGSHGRAYDITVDDILVGAGRTPNVDGLALKPPVSAMTRRASRSTTTSARPIRISMQPATFAPAISSRMRRTPWPRSSFRTRSFPIPSGSAQHRSARWSFPGPPIRIRRSPMWACTKPRRRRRDTGWRPSRIV